MKHKKYFLQEDLIETMETVSNGGITLLDKTQVKLFKKLIKAIRKNQEIIILIDDKDEKDEKDDEKELYVTEF
jgi:hypothetical protein